MADDKESLKRPNASEMCPPGYHVVKGHERVCHSGTTTWVDAHIRKNRGKIIPGLLIENLLYLYWNSEKIYPNLDPIKGFRTVTEYPVLAGLLERPRHRIS
jgi:hypothetical protein